MITDMSINLNEPAEPNTTISVINESENELLKIEIEKLKSKIDNLKNQPFSFVVIQENDSLINYYTGLPNKETINFFFLLFLKT